VVNSRLYEIPNKELENRMIVLTFEIPADVGQLWKMDPATVLVYLTACHYRERTGDKEIPVREICPLMDRRVKHSALAALADAKLLTRTQEESFTMPDPSARRNQIITSIVMKPWAHIEPRTKKLRPLTYCQRKVWAYLCSRGATCYETSHLLASALGISDREVYRSLNALEARGLIEREGWNMSAFRGKRWASDKQKEIAKSYKVGDKASRVRRITLLNPHRPGESFFEFRPYRHAWKALIGDFADPRFSELKDEMTARVLLRLGFKLFRSDPFHEDKEYYQAQEVDSSDTRRVYKFNKGTMYWNIANTKKDEHQQHGTIHDLADDAGLDVAEFEDLIRSTRTSVMNDFVNKPSASRLVTTEVGDASEI